MIDAIKAAGYRVFVRPNNDPRDTRKPTYCFYTDGNAIAYAQWETFRESVSTVHKPNRFIGTGFLIADSITPETLRAALDCHAPSWATRTEREAVAKYRDMAAYMAASKFNSELVEV